MALKPKILKAGDNPKCVHREEINSDLIGTCADCHQVRSYNFGNAADTTQISLDN